MNKEIVNSYLEKARVFYVATVDQEGNARVRPFGAHLYENGELYFMTPKMGNKVYGQMKAHPQMEICAFVGREWIRLEGEAEFLEDLELAKKFAAAAPGGAQRKMQDDEATKRSLQFITPFKLNNATVTVYSFDGKPEVTKL